MNKTSIILLALVIIIGYSIIADDNSKQQITYNDVIFNEQTIVNDLNLNNNVIELKYRIDTLFQMNSINVLFRDRLSADQSENKIIKQINQSYKLINRFHLIDNRYEYIYLYRSNNKKLAELALVRTGNRIVIITGNNIIEETQLTEYVQTFP